MTEHNDKSKGPVRLPADVHVVDDLVLEDWPEGIHRLLLNLVHDGFGFPVRIPILIARGANPGPVFGITCALHGNEVNGIPVVHNLFDKLQTSQLHGTIVAVLVTNVPAYTRHQRWFIDGKDLNHVFPGLSDGDVSRVYVARLMQRLIPRFNMLMDLHTASVGRINSLYVRADMSDATTARMAYLQRPQIIVHNKPNDRTLRGAANALGIPAITVEIGNPQRFQPKFIRKCLVGMRSVLYEAGMLQRRNVAEGEMPVLCESSFWTYTDHGGLLEVFPKITQHVEAGEVYARLSDIWGDVTREYTAQEAGVVIGKAVDPVADTGARLVHFGVEITPDHETILSRDDSREGLQRWKR